MPYYRILVASWIVLLLTSSLCLAQPAAKGGSERAAFLFAYHLKPGMQPAFDEGYRRHLAWHQAKKDSLLWYAWYVTSGDRTGLFIDGSFGAPFAAFDHRVEPQADAADFTQTAAPFSEPAFRRTYRLRSDLSIGHPLEDQKPSPMVEVTYYQLHPGRERQFEEVLGKLHSALEKTSAAPIHTWYELTVGGEQPGYMLMVPRQAWGDYDAGPGSIAAILERGYSAEQARTLEKSLAEAVARVQSEIWSYRNDLSYFPPRP